jgi:hypothetical protein
MYLSDERTPEVRVSIQYPILSPLFELATSSNHCCASLTLAKHMQAVANASAKAHDEAAMLTLFH